jgi:hypothetical protein
MIKAGVPHELVKSIAESANYGRTKVARTMDVEGTDGTKLTRSFDDFNQQVGGDVNAYVAPVSTNLADRVVFNKPVAGMSLPMGRSPDSVSTNSLAREKFNYEKTKDAQTQNKPVWNNEVGAFITAPSAENPNGSKVELAGYTKPEKPLTETQAKAVTFASRMNRANEILNDLSLKGTNKSSVGKQFLEGVPLIGGGLGNISNNFISEDTQKLEQAKRDWVNANLRNESGAAIGKDEFANAEKQYFPQIGEGSEVIKQKANNRKLAEEGMRSQAGQGASKIDSILKSVPYQNSGWSMIKVN